jgi:crotonobetainyl-CoA:carnitine CoA-transferase CaiB-like acyl-CoA transferase
LGGASRLDRWGAPRFEIPHDNRPAAQSRGIGETIARWSRDQEADAIEHRLQAAGVPAHVVSRGDDLVRDPDLLAAGYLKKIDDPVFGEADIEGPRFSLDRTCLPATRRGPRIGEHTTEVLTTVLGLSEAEIAQLGESGVLV